MTIARLFTTLFSVLLPFASLGLAASTPDAPPLNPTSQPLVVLRAATGATIETLLETRQAKALQLADKDFSGAIPGVQASVDSLQTFIKTLSSGNAKNIWYCLSQSGSSLANQTGALGWDDPGISPHTDNESLVTSLHTLGLDASRQKIEASPLDDAHSRIVISRDAEAKKEILSAAGTPDNGWRGNLLQFVADRNGGLGVWANTRPLLGLLSVLSGIDFRAKLNAHNMGIPVSAQIQFFNNKGDLGFDAKVNHILPADLAAPATAPLLIQTRTDALIDLNLPTPAGLWDILDMDKDVFFLANINILALIPRSVNATLWRDGNGRLHWSIVCLMGNKTRFAEQLKRVHAWLDILSAVSSDALTLTSATSPWGDDLREVRLGSDSFVMGVANSEASGRDNTFLILSGSAEDWPNPFDLKLSPAPNGSLAHWRVTLDALAHNELVQSLTEFSRERGAQELTFSFFKEFVPYTDTGYISMEGKSLYAISTHGLMPMLVPGFLETLRKHAYTEKATTRVAASSSD